MKTKVKEVEVEAKTLKIELKKLVKDAIPGQFAGCANSYINAGLEDWLRRAAAVGCYDGPFVGSKNDVQEEIYDKYYT